MLDTRLEMLNAELYELSNKLRADNEELEARNDGLDADYTAQKTEQENELAERREAVLAEIEGSARSMKEAETAERQKHKKALGKLERDLSAKNDEIAAAEGKLEELRALLREAKQKAEALIAEPV